MIAGAVAANTQLKLNAILWLGFVLCSLVALTLYRNYVALIWILQSLRKIPDHPVLHGGAPAKRSAQHSLFGVNTIIGVIIPLICCSTLLTGAILASFSVILAK